MTTGQTIAAIVFVAIVGGAYLAWTLSAFKYHRARRTDWRKRERLDGSIHELAWILWLYLHAIALIVAIAGGLAALANYAWGTS